MKTTSLKPLSLLGISLALALSVEAQEPSKVKINDNEVKYKSDDVKVKEEKNETKYKSDDVKVKLQKEEAKYKSDNVKIKENENERKIKAKVTPVRPSTTVRTEMKTGETQIRTREHLAPLAEETTAPTAPVAIPAVTQQVAIPKNAARVKGPVTPKYAASKSQPHKRVATRKTAPKYIVRTQVVKDTVFVPSPPEKVLATQTEYVHDTVLVTRVDTVVKVQTTNTNSGYQVPAGDFKKVKLKKDKDGEVRMKRKE